MLNCSKTVRKAYIWGEDITKISVRCQKRIKYVIFIFKIIVMLHIKPEK